MGGCVSQPSFDSNITEMARFGGPFHVCQSISRPFAGQERWSHIFPPILSIGKRAPSASNFGSLCPRSRRVQGGSLPRVRNRFHVVLPIPDRSANIATISVTTD